MTGFESWIDRQIREAQERGEFDNLPGAGKPLTGLDGRRDDDWWAKGLLRRERLPMPLPAPLALRKEVEDLPARLATERREQDARHVIDDLNARILRERRRAVGGPPVFVRTVDVDEAMAQWRTAREEWQAERRRQLEQIRSERTPGTSNKKGRR